MRGNSLHYPSRYPVSWPIVSLRPAHNDEAYKNDDGSEGPKKVDLLLEDNNAPCVRQRDLKADTLRSALSSVQPRSADDSAKP